MRKKTIRLSDNMQKSIRSTGTLTGDERYAVGLLSLSAGHGPLAEYARMTLAGGFLAACKAGYNDVTFEECVHEARK
jgi:hypothetical protein